MKIWNNNINLRSNRLSINKTVKQSRNKNYKMINKNRDLKNNKKTK